MNHTCLSNMFIKNGDSVTFRVRMPHFSYYNITVERCGTVLRSTMEKATRCAHVWQCMPMELEKGLGLMSLSHCFFSEENMMTNSNFQRYSTETGFMALLFLNLKELDYYNMCISAMFANTQQSIEVIRPKVIKPVFATQKGRG